MGDTEENLPYKVLMGVSGATALASAGVLAVANGHLDGLEYVDQAHEMLPTDALFLNPETSGGADSIYEQVVGNIDTAAHFLSGAAISGTANKLLEPDSRATAAAVGLATGALGYTMLKEGMYEGAYNAIDISLDSLQTAAADGLDALAGHVYDELADVDYGPDQWRDFQADTAGVLTERSLSSTPSPAEDTAPATDDADQPYEEAISGEQEPLSSVNTTLEPEDPETVDDPAMAYDDDEAAYAEA